MSLIKQLWLAITMVMAVAFSGSMLVSVLSARQYLQQELRVKNNDNAAALALTLSQLPKDPVTVELQVAAQFDLGHYRQIRLVSPTGEVIVQRVYEGGLQGVPAWFTRLFPIQAAPGQSLVQDGWKQFGTLTVASHEQYAYQSLWQGVLVLLGWFVLGAAATGILGTVALRYITRPLGDVVAQAHGIAERRLVHIAEPRTPELRAVARAMNGMVEKLTVLFSEEAARLESLRQKAHSDPLTGLATRGHFLSQAKELLAGEDAAAEGVLLVVRLIDLAGLNLRLGEARTDDLVRELGEQVRLASAEHLGQPAGRLKGGEFALMLPGRTDPAEASTELHERLMRQWLPHWSPEAPELFHLGAVHYERGQPLEDVFNRMDESLARAATLGPNARDTMAGSSSLDAMSVVAWRRLLRRSVSRGRLRLVGYPVVSSLDGHLLHQECVVRLRTDTQAALLTAGEFMPMAARLNLTTPIDLQVVRMALVQMADTPNLLAINLSAESVADFAFRHEFMKVLQAHPGVRERLLVEVTEHGVFRHFDAFRDLVEAIKPLGCRVGIEYFGPRFAEGHRIVHLALDYIKVHPSYVEGIAQNPQSQEFLQGLCRMARNLGIEVIALGVTEPGDIPLLAALGVDGVTGPAIKQAGSTPEGTS